MGFQAPESLAEQIAQHIGKQIILGHLKPGERVQELKLSRELDVSRGSVREALLILQGRHLVEIYARRGAVVSRLSPEHVESLYDIYIHLLTLLVTRYADLWEEHDLSRVIGQIQRINRYLVDESTPVETIVEAGFDLMSLGFPVVKNPYLQEVLESLRPAVSRTYYLTMKYRREESYGSLKFYNAIFKAVQERDLEEIRRLLANYAQRQKELAQAAIREQGESVS